MTVAAEQETAWKWESPAKYGEQIGDLREGVAGYLRPDGRICSLPEKSGHVFFGPYLSVPDGRYRVTLRLEDTGNAGRGFSRAVLEVVLGGNVVATKRFDRAVRRSGIATLDFNVRNCDAGVAEPLLEFRLQSWGALKIAVASVTLQQRKAFGSESPSAASPEAGSGSGAARRRLEFTISPRLTPPDRPISRIIAYEDWDDPAWSHFLGPDASAAVSASEQRDRGHWEQTHLLYSLDRCGKLALSSRILVAATLPDKILGLLTEYAGRVEMIDLQRASDRNGPAARLHWSDGALYARSRLAIHEPGATMDSLEASAYDVIAFPHGSLFCGGVTGIARLMASAERLLVPGGVLAFKAELLMGSEPDINHFDTGLLVTDGFVAQIETETGFTIDGGFDARWWPRIVANGPLENCAVPEQPYLMQYIGDRLAVPSLWFLCKNGQTRERGWQSVEKWLLNRLLGEQLQRLVIGPAGYRDDAGDILTARDTKGCVFFGPYVGLPSGPYLAVVEVDTSATGTPPRLRLDIVVGLRRVYYKNFRPKRNERVAVRLPFMVPPQSGDVLEKVEIRAWSSGGEAAFMACGLHQL